MRLFEKLFNSSSEAVDKKELHWIPLNSINQLDDIKDKSSTKTQIIFKHSSRCGTSRMVLKQFEQDYVFSENSMDLYFLDLIAYRDVSNEIASQFNVVHESPQLLVVKNGVVVAHSSHGSINNINLGQFI
ncbi:bacillithiol system redox-active protein YtxJ [Gaetbulibacter aquiaggeris]|uniref:Bacillithiol system redox-active protein YtxJ n=1 Tax=Gaetbulibacter aquiaggeris TaxID=1735373 RepID=A0ABW7MTC5_9FLAO